MLEIKYVNKTKHNIDRYKIIGAQSLNRAFYYMQLYGNFKISIIFVTDEEIKELNKDYRDIDSVTDVLTFNDEDEYLGDVFIALDRVKEQSVEMNHTFKEELSFIYVHAFLHALDYEHETDEDLIEMLALQKDILTYEAEYLTEKAEIASKNSFILGLPMRAGAAVMLKNGLIFTGTKIDIQEKKIYAGAAENAIFNAISYGCKRNDIIELAVITTHVDAKVITSDSLKILQEFLGDDIPVTISDFTGQCMKLKFKQLVRLHSEIGDRNV